MTIGKKNSTLKKQKGVQESKIATTGIKNLVFWHEASEGDKSISYANLVFPTGLVGEVNPTSAEILSANLGLFKNNVKVFSSLNGELMTGLTCIVKTSQIVFLNGYEAEDGEIFKITYKNQAITGTNVVDAKPLTATGVLDAGDVDFAVGEAFPIGKYSQQQVGEVLVFVDGELQHRNAANADADPSADGNYQEVASANGFGSVIRFNEPFIEDKPVQVISRNLIVERPDISMMQLIETLGGQIDKIIEYIAQDLGVDPTIFQVGPNEIDLKQFGDLVYQNRKNIATNTAAIAGKQDKITRKIEMLTLDSDYSVNGPISEWERTALVVGKWYRISGSLMINTNSGGLSVYAIHDGNQVGYARKFGQNENNTCAMETIFKATTNTLTFEIADKSGTATLDRDSVVAGIVTRLIIEEINDEDIQLTNF